MSGQKIKDLTVRYFHGIYSTTSLERAWDYMIEKQVKTLPVVDEMEHLIGLITMHDITLAYIKDIAVREEGNVKLPLKNVLDTVYGTVLANERESVLLERLVFTTEDKCTAEGEETVIKSKIPEDTIRRILVRSFPVNMWMKRKDFLSVQLEDDAEQCACRVQKTNYRYFPVLNGEERVVGVISREELLYHMDRTSRVRKGYCNVPADDTCNTQTNA